MRRHKSAVLTCLVRKAKFWAIPNLNQIIQSLPSCESESHCTNCLDSSHSASQELSRKLVSHYQIVRRHNSLETASCKSSPSVLGYQQIKSLCVCISANHVPLCWEYCKSSPSVLGYQQNCKSSPSVWDTSKYDSSSRGQNVYVLESGDRNIPKVLSSPVSCQKTASSAEKSASSWRSSCKKAASKAASKYGQRPTKQS